MEQVRISQVLIDHAEMPRNCWPLIEFDGHAEITGPCGDTMNYWIVVKGGRIDNVSFTTSGCGSSHACGSMTTLLAMGKTLDEAFNISQQDVLRELGGVPKESEHCALLSTNTLKAAIQDYRSRVSAQVDEVKQGPNESDEAFKDRRELHSRLSRIKHKILILSGKGGVGKSTVAVNLAASLVLKGKKVGLLDVDIHGPSIPTMLGLENISVNGSDDGMIPVDACGMKVMSIGFFLNDPDEAVIWRGPRKMAVIKQFLKDVNWGELDYLIVDSPPGTGDEPLSVCQLIGKVDGAVIVTTPQKVAAVDVKKSVTFCRQLDVPILGVVENMSGFVCPKCKEVSHILPSGGGKAMSEEMKIPFAGSIPMDPAIALSCDNGKAFLEHYSSAETAKIINEIIRTIILSDK